MEKAASDLVRRAAELARRSEELNRQLLRLAQALARPAILPRVEPAGDPLPPARGILGEVRELLDGPGEGGRRP